MPYVGRKEQATDGAALPPALGRDVVELVRPLPRHRGVFLEASALTAAQARHVLQVVLPASAPAVQLDAYGRLLAAVTTSGHNLAHAEAIVAYLQGAAPLQLRALAQRTAGAVDVAALQQATLLLRRLLGLPLRPAEAPQAQTLRAQLQQRLAEQAAALPPAPVTHDAEQVRALLEMSPLVRIKRSPRQQAAQLGPPRPFTFVSAQAERPLHGIEGPSAARRGRFAKIHPLLLEDNGEWVDKVVQLEPHRGHSRDLLPPEAYARQTQAQRLCASPLAPIGTYRDDKGDVHDVVPRFDGDLVHLMEVLQGGIVPLGVAARAADEVLLRLAKLAEHGWVHLDVKPDNILWRRDGTYGLDDFGCARPASALAADVFVGTAGFAAPEVMLGNGAVTPAADLFGLGMTLSKILAPAELAQLPLYVHDAAELLRDPDLREVRDELVAERCATYRAYAAERAAGLGMHEGAVLDGPTAPYHRLWRALASHGGAAFAALVVDQWLAVDPAARGTAAAGRRALAEILPPGHPAYTWEQEILRQSAGACSYTVQMDATFAQLRAFRDEMARAAAPPSAGP